MPLVGSLMRHGGGLFIRRVFGNDELYRAVFFEYMALLLSTGHSLEVFIEGQHNETEAVAESRADEGREAQQVAATSAVSQIPTAFRFVSAPLPTRFVCVPQAPAVAWAK